MHSSQNRPLAWLWCAALWLTTAPAVAQTATPSAPASTQGHATQPEAGACVPSCRSGYFCSEGQCKSLCNPPCEPGLMCTQAGQCALAAPGAHAGTTPMVIYQQAPPMNWHEQRRLARRQRREDRREHRRQMRQALDYRGRFYVGGHFTLFGNGDADDTYLRDSNSYDANRYAVGSQLGFEAGFEFRMGKYFGLGPALRYSQSDYRGADLLNIAVTPTFHMPLGLVEVLVPVNFGFTLAWDNEEEAYYDDGVDGIGFVIGVSPGIVLWPTSFFGIYANVGLTGHLMAHNGPNRLYAVSVNSGITFAY